MKLADGSRDLTPDSDVWGSNASTVCDLSPALSGGGDPGGRVRRVSYSDWDDDEVEGGRFRQSKRPRMDTIPEAEEEGHPRHMSLTPRPPLRSTHASRLRQSFVPSVSAVETGPAHQFSFTMTATGEIGHCAVDSRLLSPSPPLSSSLLISTTTSPSASSPTSPTIFGRASRPSTSMHRRISNKTPSRPAFRLSHQPSASAEHQLDGDFSQYGDYDDYVDGNAHDAADDDDDDNESEDNNSNSDYVEDNNIPIHQGDAAPDAELFNWIHGGNPPPLNTQNIRLAGNAGWLHPGQVDPVPPKPPKPPCPHGACTLRTVAGR